MTITACPGCGEPLGARYGEGLCWPCYIAVHPEAVEPERNGHKPAPTEPQAVPDATIVTLEEFAAIDEPGAAPLLGDDQGALIAEGSDVMVYGDGGAGKTTLLFDLAFHLAAGRDWLGFPIARAVRLLVIENEGPRPLLRDKLRRKLQAWDGPPLDGRITVFEEPWARFTFAQPAWQQQLGDRIREREIDVLIAGPLTRLGMDGPGTLQEVATFMRLVGGVRERSGRLLTPIIVHHENKGGSVSGAWEGAGDTLLHVQAAGNGRTVVFIQKARWASAHHHQTLNLAWTDGEGFELESDRDYVAEVRELLSDSPWLPVKQIAKPEKEGGIGASEKAVKAALDDHPELFEVRTGDEAKAVGWHPNAKVWGVRSGASAHDADASKSAPLGGGEGVSASASPLKGRRHSEHTPDPADRTASDPQRTQLSALVESAVDAESVAESDEDLAARMERILERHRYNDDGAGQ